MTRCIVAIVAGSAFGILLAAFIGAGLSEFFDAPLIKSV